MGFIYHRKNRRKYSLKAHIVLVTKYRRKLLDASLSQTLKAIAQKIAEENNFSIITMQTDKDHIHLLVDYDTTQTIADIVNLEMLPEYASVCEDILTGNKDKYSE